MKTVVRVIDLGNGYGKVVRYFFPDSERWSCLYLSEVIALYRIGYIHAIEATHLLSSAGYSFSDIGFFIRVANISYQSSRKEVTHD